MCQSNQLHIVNTGVKLMIDKLVLLMYSACSIGLIIKGGIMYTFYMHEKLNYNHEMNCLHFKANEEDLFPLSACLCVFALSHFVVSLPRAKLVWSCITFLLTRA